MTILCPQSGIPWIDPYGDPYAGAKAYFYNAGTTTPKTVYTNSDKDIPHDHPVTANGSGMFPAVFVDGGDYRLRIVSAAGATIWDVDGISVPPLSSGGGGGGDTPVELLARTGDYKFAHRTGALSGWVRANGRTIGSASSGATERANADCEALFLLLWAQDSTLAVSGGRGANAASDWASNKNIALPDLRQRTLIGMTAMGASNATLIAAGTFDGGENGNTLGATVGAGTVTLTTQQIPAHNHTGTTGSAGAHNHTVTDVSIGDTSGVQAGAGRGPESITRSTSTAGSHEHTFTTDNAGGGQAHANVQPSAVATCYIKL